LLHFDITNVDYALQSISNLTKIKADEIVAFISSHIIQTDIYVDGTALTGENFINEFQLSPYRFDADGIKICALHYTSNNDENLSILQSGLRDLQYSLTADTPLKAFLSEYGIIFDVEHRIMYIGTEQYDISYRNGSFDLKRPVTGIARKVYYDNALTCFLYVEDVSRYLGQVHIRPEILCNLDQLFPKLKLSQNWAKRCNRYEIKFYLAP